MAARLFLFSGTDLYAIQAAVKQIRERFIAKYDDISVYRFAVDQLSGDQLTKQLSEVIQLEGLFADTRLLILSGIELLNQAKFKSLKSLLVQIPDHESVVCIVVAPGDGSVYEALRAEKGLQAILSEKVCNLPSTPVAVVSWASAQIVPFGATLGEGAKQWLARYYKMAFSQARLLREEYDRAQLLVGLGAGLYQALQQAAVLESEIQAETLERLHGQLQGTIGAFEITSLLSQGNTESRWQWR